MPLSRRWSARAESERGEARASAAVKAWASTAVTTAWSVLAPRGGRHAGRAARGRARAGAAL